MIKNSRDMPDAAGRDAFDDPHGEVPVLGTFVADAETADFAHKGCTVNTEVADKILGEKQIGVPVGLEIRAVANPTFVELVLVAVDKIGIGKAGELERHAGQRMGTEFVVVIQKRDKLALRQFKC